MQHHNNRAFLTKRYSKEAEDIEGKPIFFESPQLQKKRGSIHKTDSDRSLKIMDKTAVRANNMTAFPKDSRVLDFKAMNTQLQQKNVVQAKKVNFQGNSVINLSEFNSLADITEILTAFGSRNFEEDNFALKKMGLHANEIFLGEYIIEKADSIEFVWNNCNYLGAFLITNYRFIFCPKVESFYESLRLSRDFFKVPLMFIDKILKNSERKNSFSSFLLGIITKDYREYNFRFPADSPYFPSIYQLLQAGSFPRFREIYAAQFAFFLKSLDMDHKGWEIFETREEFMRQGMDIVFNPLDKEDAYLRYIDNQNGRVCSTYPFILVVPAKMTEENVQKCANFRSRERLPALTFCYSQRQANNKLVKTFLWRSSQCKSGMTTQRSVDDEFMLKSLSEKIVDGKLVPSFLKIFDARPYLNAMVNKIDGKGYENTSYYKNSELRFLGIHNIQKVRDAYRKICYGCYCMDDEKWFEQSQSWFELLKCILSGALEIVIAMKKGFNCLIHCSDGWDRTSQLLSLVQLMLDPYFRTIKGFIVLVEKEWVSFGHQFAFRSGHSKNVNDDQKSPIFLQFLDCVHQLVSQFPLSFEFNINFLVDIAFHTYSCYFGTFLYDTILERASYQTQERTLSLWSYLLGSKEKYINAFYKKPEENNVRELFPSISIKFLRLWKEFFLRYLKDGQDKYNFETFTEDVLMKQYSLALKEKELLRQEINKLKKEIDNQNKLNPFEGEKEEKKQENI